MKAGIMLRHLLPSADHDMPPMPSLDDFFPEPFAFIGTPFEMNRIMLIRLIAAVALVLIFSIGAARARRIPGRFQSYLETALDFVRVQIVENTIESKKLARRYTPALTILFFGVFALNITGLVPFMQIAGTSVVGMPIVFALYAYVLFIFAGIREQGVLHFFKSQLFPPGLPKPVYLLITPIEAFSTFVVRPATLVIRLLANMVAGHLLLALTFFGSMLMFQYIGGLMASVGVLTMTASIAVFLLELLVSSIQAFVFTLLTAVYIQLSVSEH